ncbi:hypothetical protein BDN72DRAFT_846637 [Pluteus cervinus]|uniref:Uncharacterized protein n=1 Tax=Pluteus cervinus TaxID=181527 RepID=A0ACD3AFS5_9AGAR|nr:hypothetical protein BDN72DRAFT_846637 [Pluteus cervinus]
MSEPKDTQPIFPPEIEEIIFSLCAQSNLEKSGNLILVAKRVYHWLKPQLYEVVIFHGDDTHGRLRFDSNLLEVHGQHVRHILFWDLAIGTHKRYYDDPATCLSRCPNIVNVALWNPYTVYDGTLVDQILSLPLTHLSFDVSSLHYALTKYSLSKPLIFKFVTHLELIGLDISATMDEIERYFPSVTHIALNADRGLPAQDILRCWKNKLQVLVLYFGRSIFGDNVRIADVPDDPRVIVMPQSQDYVYDWNEATRDGPGSIWRKAEVKVKRRRSEFGL